MARITVEDCIDKFESRFELVLVASNRARKLHSGENPTIEKDNDKPTVIALREIASESLPISSLKDNLILEYQTVSPLEEEEVSLDYAGLENEINEINDKNIKDNSELNELNDKVNLYDANDLSESKDESFSTSENDENTNIIDESNL